MFYIWQCHIGAKEAPKYYTAAGHCISVEVSCLYLADWLAINTYKEHKVTITSKLG